MEVITTLLAIQFWLLVNRAFTTREGKRLFGIIASGGSLASTIIGFSIRPFVNSYGTDYLLVFTAGFILLSLGVIYTLKPFVLSEFSVSKKPNSFREKERKETLSKHPVKKPYLKIITLTIVISTLVATIVDYQLKIIASETLNEADMASLFGFLFGIIGVMSVVMQFFVTGRIVSNFGIFWGLMFLPIALITGNILLLVSPVIISAMVTKTGDQIFRFTIHNTSNQLLWLPVPSREKDRAKPFIDGTMKNSAQAMAGILILGMVQFLDIRFLTIPSLILVVIWIFANFKLKKGYISELQNAIEKRQLDFDTLEIDIQDPFIVSTLRKALREGDEYQKLFALESMKDVSLSPWISDLRNLFQNESPVIQRKILELSRNEINIVSNKNILVLMESEEDDIAVEAMIICGERKIRDGIPFLKKKLSSVNNRHKSAAAASILLMDQDESSQARNILDRMLLYPINEIQIAALQSVGNIPEIVTDAGLQVLLKDDSPEVRRLAINLAGNRNNPNLIPHLIENLENPHFALSTLKVLKVYDPDIVISSCINRLNQETISKNLIIGIVKCLSEYPDLSIIDPLIDRLHDPEETVVKEITNALLKISHQIPFSEKQLTRTTEFSDFLISNVKKHQSLLQQFLSDETAYLIKDFLSTTIQKNKSLILKLVLIRFPDSPVETILHTIFSGDPAARANALEMLDNLFFRETREKIIPLFEKTLIKKKVGKREHKEEALAEWLESKDEWTSVIALDYLLSKQKSQVVLKKAEHLSFSILHKEIISRAFSKEEQMYSTLEKTVFLKGVDLFKDISGEEVSHVAQIANEIHLPLDERIVTEGDAGDSMYIIVNGLVRIHKFEESSGSEKEIATLSNGEFIGEMALLDQQPRSASATVKEEAVLFHINGEDFYDLMASRMEIMQGIVKVLTRRLREAIA